MKNNQLLAMTNNQMNYTPFIHVYSLQRRLMSVRNRNTSELKVWFGCCGVYSIVYLDLLGLPLPLGHHLALLVHLLVGII